MFRHKLLPFLIAVAPIAAAAAPETFTLDPYHSFANFTFDHLGLSTVYGRFQKTSGKFTLDRAAKTGSVEVGMDANSVDTGDAERGSRPRSRNEMLRSADYFNAAEFPQITFKSTRVAFSGDAPSGVEGNLTLLGVTRPVTLKLERFKCITNPVNKKERCGGNASATIRRSDFGMKTALNFASDEIPLMIGFEGDKD